MSRQIRQLRRLPFPSITTCLTDISSTLSPPILLSNSSSSPSLLRFASTSPSPFFSPHTFAVGTSGTPPSITLTHPLLSPSLLLSSSSPSSSANSVTSFIYPTSIRAMSTSSSPSDFICIDAFCKRQFATGSEGDATTSPINYDMNEFLQKCIKAIDEKKAKGETILVDGYAPFCKHIFIENFTDAKPVAIEITPEIEKVIKTSYISRTPQELPILHRYVNATDIKSVMGRDILPAKYLDLILYSRAQIIEENKAMNSNASDNDTSEWGIVSIKPQNVEYECPMQPITMMRNALGKEEGGSGVTLNREKYLESVAFWSKNVSIQ